MAAHECVVGDVHGCLDQITALTGAMAQVSKGRGHLALLGELCVRAPHVTQGYWNNPEATRELLRGGWLHTGDMARADADGYVHIVDRKKDMIISGGFNIYPQELEQVLAEHPGVAMAAVFGIPDDKWGEAVRAVVVPRADGAPDAAELIAFVRARKGPAMAPKTVEFLPSLPLTGVGKVDKKALRAPFWAGRRAVN